MQWTVLDLAEFVGGRLLSPAASGRAVTGVAAIDDAEEGDVSFLGNSRYLPALKRSRATAVLVPRGFSEAIGPAAVEVENPSLAFAEVVARFTPPPIAVEPGIHPSAVVGEGVSLGQGVSVEACAVIEPGAQIGARTVIGAHCYIGHGAVLGEDVRLHPRCTVAARCVIGDRVVLQSGVVIGSDGFGFEFSGGRHVKIDQVGIVQIDQDVEIGANSTVDRARFGRTWIREGTKIDNLVQIGHNVTIGRHCLIVAQVGISGSTRLGDHVVLAGQVGVVGHLEIGDGAVVGAQSGVSKSLAGHGRYFGSPAVVAQRFKENLAHTHRLSRYVARLRKLEQISGAAEDSSEPQG